ncbi:MAG: LacI family DNA-binding transcriptional regulator [Vallitaleaceae bacterium]|nr:LacI family DNA-binding transcriptional regulator [Vallitaleaceae bacterium]
MKAEEIAKLAGVSRSTVSRVINNYSNVPEETKKKVMEVIAQYNYRPNAFARTLAGKKSETIGVFFVISGALNGEQRLFHNDFFTAYLDSIVDLANNLGYYVLVQTIYNDDDFDKVSKAFMEKRIDGGILIGTRRDTLERIQLETIDSPLVIFDYDPNEITVSEKTALNITLINTLDKKGIAYCVKYLKERGHKRIGFIKGNHQTLAARSRYDAYQEALKENQLDFKEELILEGEFEQKIAYQAMENAIQKKQVADAYICSNDYMAIAAIECLRDHGYTIPDEVSFIGFDNTYTGQLMNPKLTTISIDYHQMAKKAIDIISNSLKEAQPKSSVPNLIEFDVLLIERDSVN